MNAFKRILLWLALVFACFLLASALSPSAPENRVWEIFTTGYDAATAEATDLGNRTETSTSNYDTASISRAATKEIPTEANRSLCGQSAEFNAAEDTATAAKPIFCFPPGTKVLMADGNTKAIENVREGDKVVSDDVKGSELHRPTIATGLPIPLTLQGETLLVGEA